MTNSGLSYVFRNAESGYYRLDMEFVGMNKDITIKKELAVEQQYHYYTPEYPDGISPKAFKKLTMENIYEGIDLVYYEKEGGMKYDFILSAGADAGKIKMKYEGASSMDIDSDGNVIITTPMGEIREEKPYTYSRTTGSVIESRYRVKNNTVLLDIAEYDESEDIIIDPARQWATYYGGGGEERGYGICTDNSGNLYVTGRTASSDFPTETLTGAYNQTTYGGGAYDLFILKFNSSGVRVWATYYGGSGSEYGMGICRDTLDNFYVTGQTQSTDFPVQALTGAYNQTAHGGDWDAIIIKFNSSGARQWATYYGSSGYEVGGPSCTDISGNLYITGPTTSSDFPTQALSGAYNQATYGGGARDAFILKFNSSGARIWATYYGGSGDDRGWGICTDISAKLYVTGMSNSSNFPTQTLTGAYNQTTHVGGFDAFILKFNSSGVRQWATYYGGSGDDRGWNICTDNSANLYVTGPTASSDFPTQTLSGAYNQTTHGGGWDVHILKFNNSGVRQWATYYGGSGDDRVRRICTDISGNLNAAGETTSSDFPIQTLTGAYNQTTYGGGSLDAYILKFNNSGARIWATYYGGNGYDEVRGICIDNSDNLYFTGPTASSNFPTLTLTGAYNQSASGGDYDAFILKFTETYAAYTVSEDSICEGDTVSFTDQSGSSVISWDWTFEGGTPGTSTVQNPSVTYNTMGTYDVQLVVSDGTLSDTLLEEEFIHVSAIPAQPNTPSGPAETCEGGSYDYTTDPVTGATLYEWMVEPSNAGTISGSGTTGTYTAASGWTGAYSVKVRASNYCGLSAWSGTLAANLNNQPLEFNLTGGGPYCEGEPGCELILDGSETGVDYEVFHDGVSTGIVLPGTGSALNFGFFTEVGFYTANGFTAYCSQQMFGENYIFMLPLPGQPGTPTGEDMVCGSDTLEYITNSGSNTDTLTWILSPTEAGTMMPGDESVEIMWSPDFSGAAFLSVFGTNDCGDGPPSDELEITVLTPPAPEILGPVNVFEGDTVDYMTAENPGNTYEWNVSGGDIVSGAGTCQVSVEWGDHGTGYVMVTEDNGTCSTTTEPFEVVIEESTVGIGDNELHNLKVYPNPARNVLNIDLGTVREMNDGMISLVNIQGKVVNTVKVTEGLRNIRINTSGVAPGLYWVQIVEDDRVIGARKIVIER
jgi:PKD repeat protein